MKLKRQYLGVITPTAPFNFDATFHKPAHFPSGDNFWQPGERWQTFRWQSKNLGAIFRSVGTTQKPKVTVEIFSQKKLTSDFVESFIKEIVYRYNLNFDLTDFYEEFTKDNILGPVIKRMRGMRPGHQDSLYEYLIIGIVLQNCTVGRSIQMMQTLFDHYGPLLEFNGKRLWCFWEPGILEKVSEEDLRSLKLGYRAKFIKRIDDQFKEGLINEEKLRSQDMQTQMKELLKLYGVGPATVWYLLFDVFHQYDFFNHISPWEEKIYSHVFPVTGDRLIKYFDRFGRYKQLAVHYVWEDLWWQHKKKPISWLAKEIRA
jgi:3-methyladenine DNA glycosylase/8-oxoguanine DNA glycosylase